jgi:parallel beta-helix repeat protein
MRRIAPLIVLAVVLGSASCGGSSPTGPRPGRATEYFVSPSGSDDNAGTPAAPWRTIRHAVAKLIPGDTLFLRGGVYSSSEDTFDSQAGVVPSGTSWSTPITIAGYPGEPVTLRPPDGYAAIRLTVGAPHHLIFQDFAIDMSLQSDPGNPIAAVRPEAIYVADGAHHIRFQRLDVGYTANDAIALSYNNVGPPAATFVEVLNSRIHHAGWATGDSGHGGSGVNNGYGIYMKTTDNVVDGNEFYDNSAYAIVAYGDRNVFRNNSIHDNGTRGGTNYGINIGSSAYPLNSSDNVIQSNTIYSNRGGISVYTNSVRTRVQNNTVYNNRPLEGIFVQGATDTVLTGNNVYANGTDFLDLGATVSSRRR